MVRNPHHLASKAISLAPSMSRSTSSSVVQQPQPARTSPRERMPSRSTIEVAKKSPGQRKSHRTESLRATSTGASRRRYHCMPAAYSWLVTGDLSPPLLLTVNSPLTLHAGQSPLTDSHCDRARHGALQRAGQVINFRVARHPTESCSKRGFEPDYTNNRGAWRLSGCILSSMPNRVAGFRGESVGA